MPFPAMALWVGALRPIGEKHLSPDTSALSMPLHALAESTSRHARPLAWGAVGVALTLITSIAVISYRAVLTFEDAAERVEHTHRVQTEIEALQSLYSRVRFLWRSYLITDMNATREEFLGAAAQVPRQIELMEGLVADNPGQLARLARVRAVLEPDLKGIGEIAERKRGGDFTRAEDILTEFATGQIAMGELGAITREMHAEEQRRLDERRTATDAAARFAKQVIVLGTLATLLLLAAAFWLAVRELRQRRLAELLARRAAAEAQDLFDNAPCGYHSVDIEGRIVRINRTWLSWLGRSRDEVVGKLLHSDLMTPESAALFREKWFPQFLRDGVLTDVEFDYVRGDGTIIQCSLAATAIRDADGRYLTSRSVVVDISERRAMDRRIRDLNAELQRRAGQLEVANRELEAFSYSVSHDLRAPLRAIDGYALMLEEDYADRLDAEGRRMLEVVRGEARRMGQLIDDLLAFSRTGRQPLQTTAVDMEAMAREAVTQLMPEYPSAVVRIGTLPRAEGDRAMLKQVWVNLVGNALKYSGGRPDPQIEIGAAPGETDIEYWVRDNGAGFDPRYAGKLFGVFQRLHSADEFPGTGVGLAIVQRVVTRHGGRVRAEGMPGAGACFFFSLPATGDR